MERDGSPGTLYGADETFSAVEFRAPLENEPRQFRFIVSPEDGDQLDLTEFARQFMRQVEKDTGRPLIWAAVNHHNTDNAHVHIVIRGVDRDGDELRIDGRYIGREMRWRAQEIVTRELGPRPEIDYSRQRTAEVGRDRLTEIDEVLAQHADPGGRLTIGKLLAEPGPEGRVCVARLQVLETMQLARQERTGTWKLADGWQEILRQMGERNDITERLWRLVGDRALRQRVIDGRDPTPPFDGVVAGKGLEDELAGTMFVAVMSRAGEACYLRVPPEVADSLRPGESVRIGSEIQPWVRPADRIIARWLREMAASTIRLATSRNSRTCSEDAPSRVSRHQPSASPRTFGGWTASLGSGSRCVCRMAGGACRPTWSRSSKRARNLTPSTGYASRPSPTGSATISAGRSQDGPVSPTCASQPRPGPLLRVRAHAIGLGSRSRRRGGGTPLRADSEGRGEGTARGSRSHAGPRQRRSPVDPLWP